MENSKNSFCTLSEFMNTYSEDDMSFYNFSILNKGDFNIYSVDNVLFDYLEEMRNASVVIELNDTEYNKYKYSPDLLAYDLYGTTELAFLILMLNNIPIGQYKEFTIKKVRLLTKELCIFVLNSVKNKEKDYINSMRNKISE